MTRTTILRTFALLAALALPVLGHAADESKTTSEPSAEPLRLMCSEQCEIRLTSSADTGDLTILRKYDQGPWVRERTLPGAMKTIPAIVVTLSDGDDVFTASSNQGMEMCVDITVFGGKGRDNILVDCKAPGDGTAEATPAAGEAP